MMGNVFVHLDKKVINMESDIKQLPTTQPIDEDLQKYKEILVSSLH